MTPTARRHSPLKPIPMPLLCLLPLPYLCLLLSLALLICPILTLELKPFRKFEICNLVIPRPKLQFYNRVSSGVEWHRYLKIAAATPLVYYPSQTAKENVLSNLIEHTLRLPPHLLHLPVDEAINPISSNMFIVSMVIAKLGLCISVYDIRSIKGGFIFPGDGASTYMGEFRLIVFRPFIGEIIVAKLKESDANGLRLSLGFFDDIYIPVHLLPTPNQGRWIWDFRDPEEAQSEEPRFVIDGSDPCYISLEQPDNSKPFAPMGTINYDGLGPVSWWEEAEMIQEDE
ncbi:DNA-directed RNA polymerase III subunit RPC8 [Gossypium australe]|uniref:DNA-directed RNA polymerase subunit n=1 Tax=Gossypium australe TaxID=47621 RepID=A0A5B6WJM1_9ROSI|nr:DNA-directed RNA polymerase III subunit RPC8 [Gossypium australe]